MESVALLIIDVQDIFLNTIDNSEQLLKRCNLALCAAEIFRIKTIITEQYPEKLGHAHPSLIKSSPSSTIVSKTSFSAISVNEVEKFLTEKKINHLLIGGLEIPICVYQTVIDAIRFDIEVTLLSDCIGGRRTDDNKTVLNFLSQKNQCNILPTETVFYSLLKNAEHQNFRDFTKLVKEFG